MSFGEPGTFVAAVVQDGSVFLDRDASVRKTIALARQAAASGARLVLFPEAFIAGYPRGLSFGAIVGSRSGEGRKLYRRYVESAITIPGPEASLLAATAADLGIYLAVGVIERDQRATSTVYCTLALWGPDGTLLNVHRKIKPTASERLIWGEGDGSGLRTVPTEIGHIGGLICWENYMPLARSALYAQGVEIYLAPTADGRETWQSTIRHVAMEGRCFVLACNQYMTKAEYPSDLDEASLREVAALPDPMTRGGSAIVGPLGEYLAGPLWDERGILFAEIDPGAVAEARFDFDACGHYSRPDLLQLQHRTPRHSIRPALMSVNEVWREVLDGSQARTDTELEANWTAQLGPGSTE
ncbi:MAG: carbon-nitrogen hydrolase family protein [Thermomicrobiales bacterium]